MRSLIAVAAACWLATCPGALAGWKTVVEDLPSGLRSISLMGTTDSPEERGIAVICTGMADGAAPVAVIAAEPSRDFSISPGAPTRIIIHQLSLKAEVRKNDSSVTMVWGETGDLAGFLDSLAAMQGPIEIKLEALPASTMSLRTDDMAPAIAEFRTACGLQG